LFALTWVCFVPALYAVRDRTPAAALAFGAIFGLVTNLGGFYWVVQLLQQFGNLSAPLALLGCVLLCLYQGLLVAVALALVRRAQRDLQIAPVWSLAVVLPALELAFPLLFPSYLGNSQQRFTAIAQIVDVTGMLGLTVLIALMNGAFYELLDARLSARRVAWARVAVPSTAFVACLLYGVLRLPAVDAATARAPTMKVGIVQTNLGARVKVDRPAEFLRQHREMTKELLAAHPEVELIIWPESVYHPVIYKADERILDAIADIGRPIILGALTYEDANGDGRAEFYNSVLLTSASGQVLSAFDKIELLTFGEAPPFSHTFPIVRRWLPQLGGFTHGAAWTNLRLGDTAFLPMVCYEDIIPALVREIWRRDGPAAALVNVTNDSWYGDTHEPLIHLTLASFRSIETRRALIRSTNTGISAVVDPAGRIAQRTGQWTRESLIADVPLIRDGSSTVYMKIGDVLGWVALALTAWGLIRSQRIRARRKQG
jgi:apolipoprotein N-acyltransferase